MAFETGENKTQDKATATKGRNVETKQPRNEEPRRDERARRNLVSRAWSPGLSEQGRSAEFVKRAKEFLEEQGNKNTVILQPDNELARELSDSFGFVIYGTHVDTDFMWHLMVFESQLEPVAMEEIKDRNRRYSRDEKVFDFETTSDAISDDLVSEIEEWLRRNVEVDGEMFFTNATVVPVEVDLDSDAVVQLFGFDAEDSNILLSDTDEPFSSKMLAKKSVLKAKLNFTSLDDKRDLTSMPLRSDLQISISENLRDNKVSMIRSAGGQRTLVEMDAYVNARWVGHEEADRDDEVDPACYVPEVVMTQSNPYHNDVYGGNFERFFLGMAALMYAKDGDVWMKGFESSLHGGGKVSSLAYGMESEVFPDGKIPSDIDIVDEDPNETGNWLRKIFYRSERGRNIPVEFAVLIKEGGVGYATNKLLLDVADDNPDALDKLINVLDNLTDGVSADFLDLRDYTDVIAGQVRVPMGYFKDADGERAGEFIDTQFVMDRLKDNYPEKLEDYFECVQIDDREFDHEEAMTKLLDIYQLVTDGQFKLKGFGTKLYIKPEFLDGLAKAIKAKDAGLNMELEANVEVNFRRGRRSQGRRASYGLSDSPLGRNRRTFSGSRRRGSRTNYRR